MSHRLVLLFIIFLFFAAGCKQTPANDPLLELLSPSETGIGFSNELREDEQLNILTFEYFYSGAGVGIGDWNKDGLQDVFFTSNMGKSSLYLNKGNFEFTDITEKAGINTAGKWGTGVSVVDINQDSLPDIYVCFAGPWNADKRANELYINNGNNTFSEKAAQYGLADTGHSIQSAFFDYDRDGDLDMYLLTNITDETGPNIIRKKRIHGEMVNTDRLYRNNNNGTFTNVSKDAGITIEGYGLGVAVCDVNDDGWPDVYVSNDYLSNDLLYINNRDGTFTDKAAAVFKHTSYSAMGNDVADFNNDGKPDICAVDMLPPDNFRKKLMFGATPYDRYRSELQYGYSPQFMRNTLQLNRGLNEDSLPTFSEIGQLSGVDATDWSWSALFADLDNDGWRDLMITNGYPRDITNRDFINYRAQQLMKDHYTESLSAQAMAALKELDGAFLHNFVFQNKKDLTFSDRSAEWGFTQSAYSSGAAYADLDNDGDLDIVINNTGSPASIYRNHAIEKTKQHYLKVRLDGPAGNLQGFGAKLKLYADSVRLFHEHYTVRGYQSTMDEIIHFGLGTVTKVDSLQVIWPDGKIQTLHNINADRLLRISYNNAALHQPVISTNDTAEIFKKANGFYNIHFKHKETPYTDFNIQPLLPHKFSQSGAGLAVGDVNGDGRDDFFAGGAYNQPGQLFVQQANGQFTSKPLEDGKKYEEDMGALFFDADNDGDIDLYVVSGGNEFDAGSPYYQDRLYINDGKGKFTRKADALPAAMNVSGSCILAADFDKDGDLDLFAGGRITPQFYPDGGRSRLLKNDNGIFTDVTDELAPGLSNAGMVTAGLWTDVNNDGNIDLIVVGEWMPVTVFTNRNGKFVNDTDRFGLLHTVGWWNSIQSGDFDQDGKMDYILGNLGTNSRFRTSDADPLEMYAGDFSGTGVRDAIISYSQNGTSYPIHPRDDVMQRLPFLKKKFQLYKDYAGVTMKDLFEPALLQKARYIKANTFSSAYLHNNGEQRWQLKALPVEAQLAPVFGILCNDYNGDGYTDVLLTGNWYATEVISGQYDAFKGLFLSGNGKGEFRAAENGFRVEGDAKGFAEIVVRKDKLLFLSLDNNDSLQVLENTRPYFQRIIKIKPDDAYAIVQTKDGSSYRKEFYYGAGYLSQTGRYLHLPANTAAVTIYNFKGESRKI